MLTPQTKRWTDTVGARTDWPEDFAARERVYTQEFSAQPSPRLGRAEEVAAAVAFLAGPRSDFTTGAVLRVDGGNSKGR